MTEPEQLDAPMGPTVFSFGSTTIVRGLFVLWAPKGASEAEPADASRFNAGFTDYKGVLRYVGTFANPWHFVLSDASLRAPKKGETLPEPRLVSFSTTPYFVICVAHPSPKYVQELLASLRKRENGPISSATAWKDSWRMQVLTPAPTDAGLLVQLAPGPEIYVPSGPARYDGWLLYRHMPYAAHADVRKQVKRVSGQLSALRYPVAIGAPQSNNPYWPATVLVSGATDPLSQYEGLNDAAGEIGTVAQAALTRFQEHAKAGEALKLTDAAATRIAAKGDDASWHYLRGSKQTGASEAIQWMGCVDDATSEALLKWMDGKLSKPETILVRDGGLWAQPVMHLRFWAIELTIAALGALYPLVRGSTSRYFHAGEGDGRVTKSFHKLGRATDLATEAFAEPPQNMLLAIEGSWVLAIAQARRDEARKALEVAEAALAKAQQEGAKPNKIAKLTQQRDSKKKGLDAAEKRTGGEREWDDKTAYELNWLVYIHSRIDPLTRMPEELEADLSTDFDIARIQRDLGARLENAVGPAPFPEELEAELLRIGHVLQSLRALVSEPGGSDATTALGREYFRSVVQRFQWQSDQQDAGDAARPATAAEDAASNGIAGAPRTFLNVGRIAYNLGMHPIRAQRSYRLGKDEVRMKGNRMVFDTIHVGKVGGGSGALGKRRSMVNKAIQLDRIASGIRRATTLGIPIDVIEGKSAVGSFAGSAFLPDAMDRWMTRPSDSKKVKRPLDALQVSYAASGVDLLLQVIFDDTPLRDEQIDFLVTRGNVQVQVLHIGAGIAGTELVVGETYAIEAVVTDLPKMRKVPSQSDHLLILRPVFMPSPLPNDPGSYSYKVPALAEEENLEWWHWELPADGAKTWHDLAAAFGCSADVLEAAPVPPHDAEGVVPQGGHGYEKSTDALPVAPEPTNAPAASRDVDASATPSAP